VPWLVTISADEEDPELADKLWAEAAVILNWIIEGARIFLTEGLVVPDSILVASEKYRTGQDFVGRFIREALEITGDQKTMTVADIMAVAEIWATDAGFKYAPSMVSVAPALTKAGCEKLDKRVTIAGQKHTVWSGLAVAPANEPDTTDTTLRLSPMEDVSPKGNTEAGVHPVHTTDFGALARESEQRGSVAPTRQ